MDSFLPIFWQGLILQPVGPQILPVSDSEHWDYRHEPLTLVLEMDILKNKNMAW